MYTTCRDKDFTLAFVCTKNACRSQIAQAWARKYAPPGLRVVSAGTHPAAEIDTEVVRIMKDQFNIDLSGQQPKTLTAVGRIDVLVTMGYGVSCPYVPGVHLIPWDIPDPMGGGDDGYREIIDMLRRKVHELVSSAHIQNTINRY